MSCLAVDLSQSLKPEGIEGLHYNKAGDNNGASSATGLKFLANTELMLVLGGTTQRA